MDKKSIDEFFSALKNGDSANIEKLGKNAAENLSEEQTEIVNKALSDQNFLNSILSSEKAQSIIRKIRGGGE